jgi:hypothetical protein
MEGKMRPEADSMLLVRAELCDRLDSLQAAARRLSTRDFTGRIESIRMLAAAYGLVPVVRLAEALEHAIARSERREVRACPTALYLARLQDAIGCERLDEEASEAILASVSVRL